MNPWRRFNDTLDRWEHDHLFASIALYLLVSTDVFVMMTLYAVLAR
jgi:hypothetical protein